MVRGMAGVYLLCRVRTRPGENTGNVMQPMNALGKAQHTCVGDAHAPSSHELFNEATEWLQYARGVTQLLADLIHEADEVDCKQVALSLEAIGAMTRLGIHGMGEARALALSTPGVPT